MTKGYHRAAAEDIVDAADDSPHPNMRSPTDSRDARALTDAADSYDAAPHNRHRASTSAAAEATLDGTDPVHDLYQLGRCPLHRSPVTRRRFNASGDDLRRHRHRHRAAPGRHGRGHRS